MTDWVRRFEDEQRHLVDPVRCTMVPDGHGRNVYAALYARRDFRSFQEFEAWLAWTTGLQGALITAGPSLERVDWKGPGHLKLPFAPAANAPMVHHALRSLAAGRRLGWARELSYVQGRLRSEDSLDAEAEEGWLTLFRLAGEEEEPLSWVRGRLPDAHYREHLISDLVVRLRVDLAGLGWFDASHAADGSRVWFKASQALSDALDHRRLPPPGSGVTEMVRALAEGEAVHLPGLGMLEATAVTDQRGARPRVTHVVRFQPDRALLHDLEEAMQSSTLPPGR